MAQIAYRVTSVDELFDALNCIASVNTDIINPTQSSNSFEFSFAGEPDLYFSIKLETLVIHQTQSQQTEEFLWAKSFKRVDGSDTLKIPYSVDYNCVKGKEYASRTYIGDLYGSLELRPSIGLYGDGEIYIYIYFGEDYLSIVRCKEGQALSYLICSSRGEQDGEGGYVLSSETALVRQSDKHVLNRLFSGSLLCYYNKFGIYRPSYPVDYIDTDYCSVGYDELKEYRESVYIGDDRYVTVVYEFIHKWYGNCTCSLLFDSNFSNKLPNYNNLVQHLDDYGSPTMSNTLNGISLLLPNYFFIDVAPKSTHEYRYVFDTPEMCYCSMYNMLGGNIVEQNYPTKGNKFMCFSLSTSNEKARKSNFYKGIAFMLPTRYDDIIEDDEELEPIEI